MGQRKKPAPNVVSGPQAFYPPVRRKQGGILSKRRTTQPPTVGDEAFMEAVNKPLAKQRVRAAISSGLFDTAFLSTVLGVSKAQVAARLSGTGSLPPAEGERVLLADQVLERGAEVFGDADKFGRWLRSPIVALGKQCPLYFMTSVIGMRIVADELETIAHGVFA